MTKILELTSDFLNHEYVTERAKMAGTRLTWDFNTAIGDTILEKYESLYIKLAEVTNVLIVKGAKGLFWAVTSPEIASIFEIVTGFYPLGNCNSQVTLGMSEVYEIGTVNRRWKLYVDPIMEGHCLLIGAGMVHQTNNHYGVLKIENFAI